jgi:hypothetical protein
LLLSHFDSWTLIFDCIIVRRRSILIKLMISNRGIYSINCSFLIFFNSSNWLGITIRHRSWLDVFIACSVSIIYFLIRLIIFEFIALIFISLITTLCRRFPSFIVCLFMCLRIWIFILWFSFLCIFVVYQH